MNEGLAVPVRGVADWERSGGAERQVGAGRDRERCFGRTSERRWRVAGRGRGLFVIGGGRRGRFRAATTAEVDAALLRQRERFGAAEYLVRHVGSGGRDDVDVG